MTGCSVARKCFVAWRLEARVAAAHVAWQVMHSRRWTQRLPIFRHSSQPLGVRG